MMSLIYLLSKFSHEAMVLELFLISFLCLCLFGFFLFKRRRYGVARGNISDQVVRAFLVELLSMSESFRIQLFGESLKINPSERGATNFAATTEAAKALAETMVASGGADAAALRSQLNAALAKNEESAKTIAQLTATKATLEEAVKKANATAASAASAAPGAAASSAGAGDNNDPALKKELAEAHEKIKALEARLAEYEVIEEDLANLKRYQQENKQLRAEIEMLRKGGATASAPEPAAGKVPDLMPEAGVVAASAIADAEESRGEEIPAANLDALASTVEESFSAPDVSTAPAGGSVADPTMTAAVQTAAATSDAAPAAEEKKADKSDEDLLSEFEKMLSN